MLENHILVKNKTFCIMKFSFYRKEVLLSEKIKNESVQTNVTFSFRS